MEKNEIKNRISNLTSIPKDVTLGVPLLTLIGNQELYIENFRGILEYTTELIRVQIKNGRIIIAGHHLNVDYYTTEDMKINGFIVSIEYISGGL